jgi:hypothetical protein
MKTAVYTDIEVWPEGNDFWESRICDFVKLVDVQLKLAMYLNKKGN